MEIYCFNSLPSTQSYLLQALKLKELSAPVAVVAKEQTSGLGSRDNSWEGGEGNLFFSFALKLEDLPKDLALNSASIYFSFIMRNILKSYTEDIWLKWPNDLYQNQSKIGGTITKKINSILVCGMGINLEKNSNSFEALNFNIEAEKLLKEYFFALEEYPTWKHIFSQYRIEFERSKQFFTHIEGKKKSLKNAILWEDGSLIIDNKREYSLR